MGGLINGGSGIDIFIDPREFVMDSEENKIYWIDLRGGGIRRMNSDGSGFEELTKSGIWPEDLFLDELNRKIYWSDSHWDETGKWPIKKLNFDGTGEEIVLRADNRIFDLFFDDVERKMYWTERFYEEGSYGTYVAIYTLYRSNLDGTNKEEILSRKDLFRVTIDSKNRKIYWTTKKDNGFFSIYRADLDGLNQEEMFETTWRTPQDIQIDPLNNKIYWTEYQDNKIYRANFDGSNRKSFLVVEGSDPLYLFLNTFENKIYWNAYYYNEDSILRFHKSNFDGSNIETINIKGKSEFDGCFGEGCKVVGGWDFANYDNDPMDDHGHGTHVAATVAGNGVLKGVAPDAEIYAYKVLDSDGVGFFGDVIKAIDRSIDPNKDGNFDDSVDIISMSLGMICEEYSKDCGPDDPTSQSVDNAVNAGVVVVIAAGNCGPSANLDNCPKIGDGTIGSPGTARKAITIGASDKSDLIAGFSSRGPVVWKDSQGVLQTLIKPDIVAPGVNICAAEYDSAWSAKKCLDDKHVAISGTSMATPHVAGAVALIKQAYPDWSPEKIKTILMSNAKGLGLSSNIQGGGRIDVAKTIKWVPKCIDTDGGNVLTTKGVATDGINIKEDKCLSPYSTSIIEYTCVNNIITENPAQNCPAGTKCLADACVLISPLKLFLKADDSLDDRIAIDSSGFGLNAFCSGTGCPILITSGKYGNAYQFDGTDDSLSVNSNLYLQSPQFTVSAWVNLDSYPTDWRRIVGKSNFNFANANGWDIVVINENGVTKLNARLGGADYIQIVYPKLPVNEWHLVTLTYDGTAAKLYIDDGVSDKRSWDCVGCNGKYAVKNIVKTIPQNTLSLMIGRSYGTYGKTINAKIDEVRYYNRAFSKDEVSVMFLNRWCVNTDNIVNYDKFGTCTDYLNGVKTDHPDVCDEFGKLWETYCNLDGMTCGSIYHFCPSGTKCSGGVCV